MTGSPVPPRQIVLAYALLLSVLAAAWFGAGQPLLAKLAQGEARITALQARIDALERTAARDAALRPAEARERIERLLEFIRQASVEAETIEVAGSLLQRRLTTVIERHGGQPGNIRLGTDPQASSISVSARFETDLPGLGEILFELVQARPSMFVELLSVRRRDHYLETSSQAAHDLSVQLDLSAFWSRPAAAGPG